jgi:DNA-binding PadR family transcriptional regulator
MVVLEQEAQDGKEMKKQENRGTPGPARAGLGALRNAESPRRIGRATRKLPLTTPDMVLLSLLAERPMHGYQANLELERREIRDWANLSRPQVYYSMEKLARAGLIRALETGEPAAGPERSTYATTSKGRAAMAAALEQEEWTTGRDRPAFLTWLGLSWQAKQGAVRKQLRRRAEFLERELARERETLESVLREVGHAHHEAVWMVSLMIAQFETERKWLKRVRREMKWRGPAKNPEYAGEEKNG